MHPKEKKTCENKVAFYFFYLCKKKKKITFLSTLTIATPQTLFYCINFILQLMILTKLNNYLPENREAVSIRSLLYE